LRPALAPPYDIVTDGRLLSAVDADGFAVLDEFLMRALPLYATRVRRHAVLHAAGLPGAVLAGFLARLGPRHRWRAFTEAAPAFAWLEAAPAAAREVQALVEAAQGSEPVVRALRGWLVAHVGAATVTAAARGVGCSGRTLQRALRDAGTSFRAEL